VSRQQQNLYQNHVAPLLEAGCLEQAEPVLNLLVQSKTRLAEVYRDLASLAERRNDPQAAAGFRDQWLDHPSELDSELLAQAAAASALGRHDQAHRLRGLRPQGQDPATAVGHAGPQPQAGQGAEQKRQQDSVC